MVQSTNSELDDLAARMAAADDSAFQEFAARFAPRLRAYFVSKGMGPSDAEDLAISSITDIALRVEKYRPSEEGGFEAWLFTLARHFHSDWWKTQHPTEPLPDNLPDPKASEEILLPNAGVVNAVKQAVGELSDTDQLIVRLRYLDQQRSIGEISERLGITPQAARTRLSRARQRLKTILKRDARIIKFLTARGLSIAYE